MYIYIYSIHHDILSIYLYIYNIYTTGNVDIEQSHHTALTDMFAFLQNGGEAAILDAANHSIARRQQILDQWAISGLNGQVVFIESVVDMESILATNFKEIVKSSPDLRTVVPEDAMRLIHQRIAYYQSEYASVEQDMEGNHGFIKILNNGRRVISSGIRGYLLTKIVFFLMNLSITRPPIYVSRHGESEYNELKLIGGNSSLTKRGSN